MEQRKKEIIYKVISSLFLSITSGLIFMFLLELIVDLKEFHMMRGFLYMDGGPSFILVPLLFVLFLLYMLPKTPSKLFKIIRSIITSSFVTYFIAIVALVANIDTLPKENIFNFSTIIFICSLIGFLLLDFSYPSTD